MAPDPLVIRGLSTISPLGASDAEVHETLTLGVGRPSSTPAGAVFRLTQPGESLVEALAREKGPLSSCDRAALLATAAARSALAKGGIPVQDIGCIAIGSARGAALSLEETILCHAAGRSALRPDTSPRTTAGSISAHVAHETCGVPGAPVASVSTSMTCTSAFHALLVACAFVRSGMSKAALFGGTEACLTPYTIAQLAALRIYSNGAGELPCTPCIQGDTTANSVVLGEGAGAALLVPSGGMRREGDLALLGIGWALESIPSATGISPDGVGFEQSMQMAVSTLPPGVSIDAVVVHAPGTNKGDEAELRAIRRTLGDVPLCSTKHLTGHTYGASGMVSLGMAQWLLAGNSWSGFPYPSKGGPAGISSARAVLVNTAGFGGNAISVVVAHAC